MHLHSTPRRRAQALTLHRGRLALTLTGVLLGAALAARPVHAQQAVLDAAHSSIGFVCKQMGAPMPGRFTRFRAEAALDAKALPASHLSVVIDMSGVTMDNADIDATLRQPDWFDTQRYAQAAFTSTAIKRLGPQDFQVAGRLTIKGQTRPVTVPMHLVQSGTPPNLVSVATGTFDIRRSDFHVGAGSWADPSVVSDTVTVTFHLTLAGLAPL